MVSYLAVVRSFDEQLIPPPVPCAVAVAPSVTPPEQPGVERESEASDDAAAN